MTAGGAAQRREDILALLMQHGTVTVEDLLARHRVSRMTVHRDLDDLVREGWAARIRGGVTVQPDTRFESDFRFRQRLAPEEKRRIAAAAVAQIGDGEAVALGYGTTVAQMLPDLAGRAGLTVATASLPCINALSGSARIDLLAVGGTYIRRFEGFFGRMTEAAFGGLMLDACFISTSALRFPVLYHPDERVVQAKLAMLGAARRRYLLLDSTKIGRSALHELGQVGMFDAIITGAALSPADAAMAARQGVRVIPA